MADPVLRTRDLTKIFGAVRAADRVNLELCAGEIHALIGPNGAGKSTIVKLITGELKPDAGSVMFEGKSVDRLDVASRARLGIARSFQVSCVVPDFTVLENVVLAVLGVQGTTYRFFRRALSDPALVEPAAICLERAGLQDSGDLRAFELSHGDRRRLEIAMAIALEPRAFLLDEPMAGIGAEGTDHLTNLISGLRTKAPVLLIEHDMDAVFALADRISVIVYGSVIATGTGTEIRANADVRKAYLGDTLP